MNIGGGKKHVTGWYIENKNHTNSVVKLLLVSENIQSLTASLY